MTLISVRTLVACVLMLSIATAADAKPRKRPATRTPAAAAAAQPETPPGMAIAPSTAPAPPADDAQIAAYKDLMELNGVAQNVRALTANNRATVHQTLLTRLKLDKLSDADETRFDQLATFGFAATSDRIIDEIAHAQAGYLTLDDINDLVSVNSSPLGKRWTALKFASPEGNDSKVQTMMVNAVVGIIKAYNTQDETILNTPASADLAADADPAKVALLKQLMIADGTDALMRHFIGSEHMRLIVNEVSNHIKLADLNETQRYTMAGYVARAQATLEDRIILMNVQNDLPSFTAEELQALTVLYDIGPQKKLTNLRLADTGVLDQQSAADLRTADDNIYRAFGAMAPPK